MDEGAFSDDENIALLNAYFVAIRAEDTQRPDVNTRYNLNGWPTIAFMAPQGELLGATNYLPSEDFGNLLARLYTGYHEKKDEIRSAGKIDDETSAEPSATGKHGHPNDSTLSAVTTVIMELADRIHGGYGRDQKFIHPDANDFLLSRYETTKDPAYLDHICLTLNRMRAGEMHDHEGGGYFRTCSNADWSRPHREKLLGEQAGLLANCRAHFSNHPEPAICPYGRGHHRLFEPQAFQLSEWDVLWLRRFSAQRNRGSLHPRNFSRLSMPAFTPMPTHKRLLPILKPARFYKNPVAKNVR